VRELNDLIERAKKFPHSTILGGGWIPFDGPPDQRYIDWLREEVQRHEAETPAKSHRMPQDRRSASFASKRTD
jgi:hypothetical protein